MRKGDPSPRKLFGLALKEPIPAPGIAVQQRQEKKEDFDGVVAGDKGAGRAGERVRERDVVAADFAGAGCGGVGERVHGFGEEEVAGQQCGVGEEDVLIRVGGDVIFAQELGRDSLPKVMLATATNFAASAC